MAEREREKQGQLNLLQHLVWGPGNDPLLLVATLIGILVLLGYIQTEQESERSEKGRERACVRGSERETNMEGGAGGGREVRDTERHVYRGSEHSDSDIQRPVKCKILDCLLIFNVFIGVCVCVCVCEYTCSLALSFLFTLASHLTSWQVE